jgi:hypothetical protein
MANTKISALSSASLPLVGTEVLPIVQSGATVKATVANITGAGAYSGAFTTLSATGVTTVQAGTVLLPAITTTGDTNTGIFFPAADAIATTVGGVEGTRLTSTGLGIGITPTVKLDVAGTSRISNSANSTVSNFIATNASFTTQVVQVLTTKAAGTDFTLFRGVVNNSATVVFNVFGNGNVTNTNNSYGAISDVKLKENIVDATPKLANLMQVKVKNYNLKNDPSHKQLGVVAQELEQVFPAMVEETIDRDADGNDLGTTTKSVKYSVFVPMLIKAVQEQQDLIASLTARLDAANL